MTAPSIVEIHPANGAEGVVLADSVRVTFDKEVDPTTVQILLEGPDNDRWSGPDQVRWDDVNTDADDDVLSSPGYHGFVRGSLTFEKVDADGNPVSGLDYTGGGTNWRTKVVFIPDDPLGATTQYRVYVFGDETDSDEVASGVSTRTVFDTIKGANLGDGNVSFAGGYNGTIEDRFYVKVKETGDAGNGLLFHWWKESSPLVVRELYTKEGSQLLSDGVSVRFSGDFEVDDEFSVVVKPGERMQNTYSWSFTTGSGSIESVPSGVIISQPSTIVSGSPSAGETTSDGLTVLDVSPANRSTNMDPEDLRTITVTFSASLDSSTVDDDTVKVWTEPVNGDPDIEAEGSITKTLTVNGNILTIQLG